MSRVVVDAIHTDMLLAHGGVARLRDENALESALARPGQRLSYEPGVELAGLAAAYGYGLARNHPYHDGNKRVAFVVMAVFLGLNGFTMTASEADVVTTIVALASGELAEETPAEWIRRNSVGRPRVPGRRRPGG